ncbi:MAG: hypothetical protein U0802_08650 [Candidatus Binatia bacterium]
MPSDRTMARVGWLLPVALAAVVWFPLTRSYFHFDDFLDLYQLRNDDPAHYFLRMYGGHLLIARHAVTAALDAAFGPNPRPFFAVVLITHLANTALLYGLVLRLTGRWALAAVAAAVWGTSPINEGALGWYAVYGQVAAATCILAVLAGLARQRGDAAPSWRAPIAWGLLMLLGGTLFGVGIAAALVMPVAAWLLLPPGPPRRRALAALGLAVAILLATYATLRALELPLYGEQRIETTFMLAGLTPEYVGNHAQLLGILLGFGVATLPLGALIDPNTFPSNAHVAAIAAAAALLIAGAWAGPATARRRLLACLLLVVGVYGLIAVARSMLSGFVGPWPLGRSLRFHYTSGALLAALLAVAAGACAGRWPPPAWLRRGLFALALAVVTWTSLGIARRINHFDGDRAATAKVLADIRAAVAAAPPGATVEIPNRDFGNVGFVNVGYRDRFPGTAAVFAIFFPDDVVDGRRVVFTSSDALVLRGRLGGRRSATLLRELPTPAPADKDPAP